jgi:hypothetical protein
MRYLVTFLLLATVAAAAPTAQLTADRQRLNAEGGTLTLRAEARYSERPGALGWAINLPEGWSLESVGGGSPPQVAAAAGTTGVAEFAYTSVPELLASFDLVVRYPTRAAAARVTATVLHRVRGELTQLEPRAIEFAQP